MLKKFTQPYRISADNEYEMCKTILITKQLKEIANEFLGAELIPACAIGGELALINGNLILKTFREGNIHGYRRLDQSGNIINIIKEIVNYSTVSVDDVTIS